MLYEKLKQDFFEYYEKSEEERGEIPHINCCERIIMGANDVYKLGLGEDAAKLGRGFGSGMNYGITCGVITGGVMAISVRYHSHPEYKSIVADFVEKFHSEFGDINCEPLKKKHASETRGCSELIKNGAKVLDQIFSKYS